MDRPPFYVNISNFKKLLEGETIIKLGFGLSSVECVDYKNAD